MAYVLEELLDDVATDKEFVDDKERNVGRKRMLRLGVVSAKRLEMIWSAMCRFVEMHLRAQTGVNLGQLGKFIYNKATDRPALSLHDNFIRCYKVQVLKTPMVFGKVLDLNYSMLAHKLEIPKDEVKVAIGEIIRRIGEMVAENQRPLMIDFDSLGTLYADHRRVEFAFGERNGKGRQDTSNPAFVKHAPEDALSLKLAGSSVNKSEEVGDKQAQEGIPPLDLSKAETPQVQGNDIEEENEHPPTVIPPFLANADHAKQGGPNRKAPSTKTALEDAFVRHEKQVIDEVRRLQREDEDIHSRERRSEIEYKQRLLHSKQEKLEMNTFLVQQSKERKARDRLERESLRNASILPDIDSNVTVFPIDKPIDEKRIRQNQKKLRAALDRQVSERKQANILSRVHQVAEEKYFLECNNKLMQDERMRRLEDKYKQRKALQGEWKRQQRATQLQRALERAKNGTSLGVSLSTGDLPMLLSVRSSLSISDTNEFPGHKIK